jgi:tetratricopeptide (TPR) repeat protein
MFDLGTALVGDGKPDEAITWLTAARREQPGHADTHFYLGLALEQKQRLPEARAAFLKSVELNPRHQDAYLALARVATAQGQREQALDAMRKAAALSSPRR